MNILVTGSSGYIGKSFINKYRGKYSFQSFSLRTQPIEDIDFSKVDVALHCAALVHQKTEYSYEKYYEINVAYPLSLAKLAKQNGVQQFVFISTIAVYGEELERVDETSECHPVSSYGKSKLEAERELYKLNDESFTVSIIRPPMVYGENAPGNIRSLVSLIQKTPLIPLGGIKNKRSFVYIGNLCHLIETLIEKNQSGVFLASDDEVLSTTRLCKLISKNLHKKVFLVKLPLFATLLKVLKPSFYKRLYGNLEVDNSVTRQKLQLKNPYSVEEGLEYMIHGENR